VIEHLDVDAPQVGVDASVLAVARRAGGAD
jgi:hypothetical protein